MIGDRQPRVEPSKRDVDGRPAYGIGQIIDVTTLNATFTGPAGDVISTVGDVAAFYRALLRGRVVQGRYLREMLAFKDVHRLPLPPTCAGCGKRTACMLQKITSAS